MIRSQPSPSIHRRAVELAIVAQGTASLSPFELAVMRQQSIERFPAVLRPQFLKHSDEQTLAALTALSNAIDRSNLGDDFQNWAIVSSTRYLGRTAFAAVIDKYQIDGPWGVSVQVIPHTTPHAVAGTVSLALGSHGPSIGAGAAIGEEGQGLLSAAALLQRSGIGGAWLLFTAWSDSAIKSAVEPSSQPTCTAAALAVVDARQELSCKYRSLGRIEVEPFAVDLCGVRYDDQPLAAPLTELLVAAEGNALAWRETRRGMRISVEFTAKTEELAALAPHELLHYG